MHEYRKIFSFTRNGYAFTLWTNAPQVEGGDEDIIAAVAEPDRDDFKWSAEHGWEPTDSQREGEIAEAVKLFGTYGFEKLDYDLFWEIDAPEE